MANVPSPRQLYLKEERLEKDITRLSELEKQLLKILLVKGNMMICDIPEKYIGCLGKLKQLRLIKIEKIRKKRGIRRQKLVLLNEDY